MPLLGNKRRKKSRAYEILIIPQGDGSSPRSIRGSAAKFVVWGSVLVAVFFLVFFLVFRFTPIGILTGVRIDDEARKRAEDETRARIESLAEEIGVLKDYNTQLRKALGSRIEASGSETAQPQTVTPARREEQETAEVAPTPAMQPGQAIATTMAGGLSASFPLVSPVGGVVTQGFDPDKKHYGVDFAAKQGTPVYAAAQGNVIFAGWTYEYGNVILLSHGSGYVTAYKHNNSLLKSNGAVVRRGEPIALVGNTGITSSGPHLHFEVMRDGVPLDPLEFLLATTQAM